MKTLVIINGVTGAIGTACFAEFSRIVDVTLIGISRKAKSYLDFVRGGHLPEKTIICSIGDATVAESCNAFVRAINVEAYEQIIYVHAIGIYPFEVDASGVLTVANDDDGDGIDDRVTKLTYNAFTGMAEALGNAGKPLHTLLFGGLADKHHLAVHQSWWKVMEKLKQYMRQFVATQDGIRFCLLNISSVICPHEILTRPHVFTHTDADPRFWLQPHEVAQEVVRLTMLKSEERFVEKELFHYSNYYHDSYFTEEVFTKRKKLELGII